jgi:hypothetical protein
MIRDRLWIYKRLLLTSPMQLDWRADCLLYATDDVYIISFRRIHSYIDDMHKYMYEQNEWLFDAFDTVTAYIDMLILFDIVWLDYMTTLQLSYQEYLVYHQVYGLVPMKILITPGCVGFTSTDENSAVPFVPFTEATVYRKSHPVMKWALICLRHRFGNDPTSVVQTFLRTLV